MTNSGSLFEEQEKCSGPEEDDPLSWLPPENKIDDWEDYPPQWKELLETPDEQIRELTRQLEEMVQERVAQGEKARRQRIALRRGMLALYLLAGAAATGSFHREIGQVGLELFRSGADILNVAPGKLVGLIVFWTGMWLFWQAGRWVCQMAAEELAGGAEPAEEACLF